MEIEGKYTRKQILNMLQDAGIRYELTEHAPLHTVADAVNANLPHPERGIKNLFLRDDKKRNYYLLTVHDTRTVDLKDIQQRIGSRRLSFANETDLMHYLKLEKGSVTPMGLLNDTDHKVKFYLDRFFYDGMITCHPEENTATLYLKTEDLIRLLEEHGCAVNMLDMDQ